MSFKDMNIKPEYRSLSDNVVHEFYIPLLEKSILYKRAVGYFSSTALIEMSIGITGLLKNGGRIQLIASPQLSEEDIEAIDKGYEMRNDVIEKALKKSFYEPQNVFEEQRLNILANLIAQERLDIKIAFTNKNSKLGIFHEKMGLMYDVNDNVVAFTGSMNETSTAFSYNYESIDVFSSWTFDKDRVFTKESIFDSIWNDREDTIKTIDFTNTTKELLQKYKNNNINYDIDKDEFVFIKENKDKYKEIEGPFIPSNVSLHDYQNEAIKEWNEKNCVGIFDMATGTGKTYTALGSIVSLYKKLEGKLAVVIVCPYQHLVEQWVEDLRLFNIKPIIGYSESEQKDYKKRLKNNVLDYNLDIKNFFCFICTNATFRQDYIQQQVIKLRKNSLLVIDEAHNFGAMNLSDKLKNNYKYRLALSATLERHNDEEGTMRLKNYFGEKCIEYPLEKAIVEKKLTPYYYHPKKVYLSEEELERYNFLSNEIGKCLIKNKNGKVRLSEKGKKIALERSRLVAGAIGKIDLLKDLIEEYKNDTHILVYCGATKLLDQDYDDDIDDIRQIDYITKMLGNDLGMKVSQFTSRENNQERSILKKEFEQGDNLQALIAIKCLDEGVNIPKIKLAFILASTTNPKEYIQRRGRVLRKADGKRHAIIYDFITLPRPLDEVSGLTDGEITRDKSLVKKELERMMEFKRLSLNPLDSDKLIDDIYETYDLYDDKEDYL